jgi:Response regulator containing a CheY-like receiver domain and an HTH DNA-binding domain
VRSQSLELTLASPAKAMRVLVVDDDDAVRAVLAEVLQEEGFEVVGRAIDGIEGVSLALSLTPDGVLLDMRMPRMGGIEAARAILAQLPNVRIVMLSAYDDASLQAEAKEAGVSAFLVKGCPLSELIDAVSAVDRTGTAA